MDYIVIFCFASLNTDSVHRVPCACFLLFFCIGTWNVESGPATQRDLENMRNLICFLFVCLFVFLQNKLICSYFASLKTDFLHIHAPVLHICHDCFLHRHLKCWFRSSCIYAKRLLKNLRKIFVSLFFVCFFFPNILFALFLVCPTILLAIQKIELTQRYEFNRQS